MNEGKKRDGADIREECSNRLGEGGEIIEANDSSKGT
jgi:hypothetical protein